MPLRHPSIAVFSSNGRSEEHTSELQSLRHLVCRLLLEKKNASGSGTDDPRAAAERQPLLSSGEHSVRDGSAAAHNSTRSTHAPAGGTEQDRSTRARALMASAARYTWVQHGPASTLGGGGPAAPRAVADLQRPLGGGGIAVRDGSVAAHSCPGALLVLLCNNTAAPAIYALSLHDALPI